MKESISVLDANVKKSLLRAQRNEITEHHIYKKLAASVKNPHNQSVLKHIADDELKHYNFWKTYTQRIFIDIGYQDCHFW